jgi:hypothetical protein
VPDCGFGAGDGDGDGEGVGVGLRRVLEVAAGRFVVKLERPVLAGFLIPRPVYGRSAEKMIAETLTVHDLQPTCNIA